MKKQRFTNWLGTLAVALVGTVAVAPVQADTILGVTQTGSLISFDSETPGTIISTKTITGLQASETVYGIDIRPSTGELHAVGSTSRQYKINPATGAASIVGSATFSLEGAGAVGVDFNPVVDKLRVVSDAEHSFVLDPTGAAAPQTGAGLTAGNVVDVTYDRSFPGTSGTALFGIDSDSDNLVTIIPATGAVTAVGSLGVNIESNSAIDFHGKILYAALRVGSVTQLYTINAASGSATAVGAIGTNPNLVGIAVVPDPLTTVGPKGPVPPKVSIKLKFAKPGIADAISVAGAINIPAGFEPAGQQVTVNVGGITKTFTLDPKGKAKLAYDAFRIKVKFSKDANGLPTVLPQLAKYKFTAKKGDFAGALADEGLTSDLNPGSTVRVPVAINLGDDFYQETRPLFYKSNGKTGVAK